MSESTTSEHFTSRTVSVYNSLRGQLLGCQFKPGEKLRINELCASFSVSPCAVREALSRLTSEGLVVAEPQRGFRVTPISAAELRDLTDTRVHIEGLCLRRAISVGDIDWEAALISANHQVSQTPKRSLDNPNTLSDSWALVHARYHEALVSACDSKWTLRLRSTLYVQAERYRRISAPLGHFDRDVDSEHREIMDAALARNADKAVELLADHLNKTTRILLESGVVSD